MDADNAASEASALEHRTMSDSEGEGQGAREEGSGTTADAAEGAGGADALSKRQRRKLLREQKWEERREERKETRKKQRHARRERQRQARRAAASAAEGAGDGAAPEEGSEACRKRAAEGAADGRSSVKRFKKMAEATDTPTVVVDLGFDELMPAKDIKHLVTQIVRCYSANRRAERPFRFHLTGFGGKTAERYRSISGSQNWDIATDARPYDEVFDRSALVYLSSESPNVIESLDPSKVYVIGGLVDHNHHKGLTHRLACEKGIAHAQLPIGAYVRMQTRKVLTVNHVFEILVKFEELRDWGAAFLAVIPQRKGAETLESDGGDDSQHREDDARAPDDAGAAVNAKEDGAHVAEGGCAGDGP